ncbi:hypothetical protein AAVH_05052 [Aphelenchoides avenae]|nr:hypothetical protein AAVH_05052 [Aphelenchus avenae]
MAEHYENMDPAPGDRAPPPRTPATELELAQPLSAGESTNLISAGAPVAKTPTDLRSQQADETAVEDTAVAAEEAAKKRKKKPKKKKKKRLESESITLESQPSQGAKNNCKRIVCMTVAAVFLAIFVLGALASGAAISYKWWT